MSRVKRGTQTKKRHKKLLKQTKGFWGLRKNIFRRAKETLMRALAYAFIGRKLKKRDFRTLFISRINIACRALGMPYRSFIHGLDTAQVKINRKMLSQLSIFEPEAFSKLVDLAKSKIS